MLVLWLVFSYEFSFYIYMLCHFQDKILLIIIEKLSFHKIILFYPMFFILQNLYRRFRYFRLICNAKTKGNLTLLLLFVKNFSQVNTEFLGLYHHFYIIMWIFRHIFSYRRYWTSSVNFLINQNEWKFTRKKLLWMSWLYFLCKYNLEIYRVSKEKLNVALVWVCRSGNIKWCKKFSPILT